MLRFISMTALIFLLSSAGSLALAQKYFKGVANTGSNATLALPTTANPNLMGAPLVTGDEIGVFTPDGLCVGATVWENQNVAIIIWGDNDQTPRLDGIRPGEQMRFCVWRQSTSTAYGEVSAAYSLGDGNFTPNGIYILASLAANAVITPTAPQLAAPADGATNLTNIPRLSWYTACGARTYTLQIANSAAFANLIIHQTGIDSTFYDFSGAASNTTYYWKLSAQNSVGTSAWSDTLSFTTGIITGVEKALPEIPQGFILHQNYPNPFNASTMIGFHLPSTSVVTLKIFDVRGSEVATLVNGKKSAGDHRARFDAAGMASGVYFYRLEVRGAGLYTGRKFVESKKLILIK
jgi:hypothetical protein